MFTDEKEQLLSDGKKDELKPLFYEKKAYFRRIVELKPLFYEKKAYFRRIAELKQLF